MKKALVTGAGGFIGTNLVYELLENNIEVVAVSRKGAPDKWGNTAGVSSVFCDLNNTQALPDLVSSRDIDVFYHLAWAGTSGSGRADYSLQLQNIKHACDNAVAAKNIGCGMFICAGTITEKIAENILNISVKAENLIYGIAKHTAHCLLEVLCNKIGLQLVWARLSNIYGPGNSTGNIVSYTLSELIKGNTPVFSKALQPYDLMYINDAVKALFLLGKKRLNSTCYFVGSGQPRMLKDYLISIKDIFGKGASIEIGKRPEDGLQYNYEWFLTNELQADTGFSASYTFEEGIRETIKTAEQ